VRSDRKKIVHDIVSPYLTAKKDRTVLDQYTRITPGPDSRIRTVLSPVVTETGRLASSESFVDPYSTNMQNISKTQGYLDDLYRVRDVIIADPGMILMAQDFDKAEAVVASFESEDWDLYERLVGGEDVHTWIASLAFHGGNQKAVTKEQRQISKNVYYACARADTEILTRKGWKHKDQLSVGDEVLGFDGESLVWDLVREINTYEEAEIIKMEDQRFTFEGTPNHEWWGETTYDCSLDPRRVSTATLLNSKSWRFRLAAPIRNEGSLEITDDEAELLGWIMGGGAPLRLGESIGSLWDAAEVQLGWEHVVRNMGTSQVQRFLDGFLGAKGWTDRHGNWVFKQNRGRKLEAARLAAFFCGYYPSVGKGPCPSVRCEMPWTTSQYKKQTDSYRGEVWCPTTNTGFWVARQDDQIFITGNSLYMAGVPTITRTINAQTSLTGLKLTEADVAVVRGTIMKITELETWWDRVWSDLMDPDLYGGTRWLQTCLGMRRKFFNPDHHKLHKEAVNFFPQAIVAERIDQVMISWYNELEEPGEAELLLQVHDELLVQVRPERLSHYASVLHDLMVVSFKSRGRSVYIPAGIETGYRWGTWRGASSCDPNNALGRLAPYEAT